MMILNNNKRVPTAASRMARTLLGLVAAHALLHGGWLFASEVVAPPAEDPHYTQAGFFDIHVCNWPGQALFFLAVFSTPRYDEVKEIELFTPQGQNIGRLDLQRFRVIKKKGKPEKRAFMRHLAIPEGSGDGWYYAHITLKNGRRYAAKDYVVLHSMERAGGLNPTDGAEGVPLPKELTWRPVPGAKHYQVFIRDLWNDEKLIHQSGLLDEPRLVLPDGLLEPGGYYAWRIHARDVNENVLLGDFNHGSLTAPAKFSVAE